MCFKFQTYIYRFAVAIEVNQYPTSKNDLHPNFLPTDTCSQCFAIKAKTIQALVYVLAYIF